MSKFFAFLSRMKYINRWSLMRNTQPENIMEHTTEVCFTAHALAVINNLYFDGGVDIQKTVMLALYHEAGEVITGDLPTPIKYFNQNIMTAYKQLEQNAAQQLEQMLPGDFRSFYSGLLCPDTHLKEYKLVKAADKLCAYIKCIEELKSGNSEFKRAAKTILSELKSNPLPEVEYFLQHFLPAYSLTLDELQI